MRAAHGEARAFATPDLIKRCFSGFGTRLAIRPGFTELLGDLMLGRITALADHLATADHEREASNSVCLDRRLYGGVSRENLGLEPQVVAGDDNSTPFERFQHGTKTRLLFFRVWAAAANATTYRRLIDLDRRHGVLTMEEGWESPFKGTSSRR
jgi:hypothetical protein